MATIKKLDPSNKRVRPRINKRVGYLVNSTRRLNRYRAPIEATSLQETKEVLLEKYFEWSQLPIKGKFFHELLQINYPVPRKQPGISPSKRLRDRWHCFKKSIDIMWHHAYNVEKAQAAA